MIDVLADLQALYVSSGQDLQTLLGDTDASKLCIDFDPANEARPYIILTQANYTNAYEPMGKVDRVDKFIAQFLAFGDTRAEVVSILDALETLYLSNTEGLSPPTVADKVTQLDRDKIDAWKGTLNLCFFVQQEQPSFSYYCPKYLWSFNMRFHE